MRACGRAGVRACVRASAHLARRREVAEARAVEVDRVRAHRGDGLARPPLRAWWIGVGLQAGHLGLQAGHLGSQAWGAWGRRQALVCVPIIEKSGTPLTRHSAVGDARQCALAM